MCHNTAIQSPLKILHGSKNLWNISKILNNLNKLKKHKSLFLIKYKHILEAQNAMNNLMRVSFHEAQWHSAILNEGQSLTGTTARLREAESPAMWDHLDWSQPVTKGVDVKMVIPQHQGYTVSCTLTQRKGYFDTVYSVLPDWNIH